MDTYSWLRELADSWVLLAMVLFYLTACAWALSPWRRRANAEAAAIVMNDETAPPSALSAPELKTCDRNCAACTCLPQSLEAKDG